LPRQVLVSNGRFAVVLDDKACIRDFYFPYVGLENHSVGHQFRFGIAVDGKFEWLDGRCTHAGAPLAEGSLNGEVLTCPWHYS